MRKVTKTYQIFKFEELSEKAKEKAKQDFLDMPFRQDVFSDQLADDLKNLFPKSLLYVQYSLSSCQGDGVNIYGNLDVRDVYALVWEGPAVNGCDFLKSTITSEELEGVKAYFQEYGFCVRLPENRYYCYCMADAIEIEIDWASFETARSTNPALTKKAISKFQNIIIQVIKGLCRDYEKKGYDFFYEISDEGMQEICNSNEWEFYEDGRVFCD